MNTPAQNLEPTSFFEALVVYLEAFAERNTARRHELLARCMTVDAEIWGPKHVFKGYANISEKIAAFHQNWPDCRLAVASGVSSFRNTALFRSAIVSSAGAVEASGHAVVELAPDGRISRVLAFWNEIPPLPESWSERLSSPEELEQTPRRGGQNAV